MFPNDDDPIQRVMLYAPGAVHEGSVPVRSFEAAPVSGSLPVWMQVGSAVVTWLGAVSVVFAVLTFRFAGPWIRLRGEVDGARQVRLVATNRGRIAGHISRLGIGTPRRHGFRLRRNAAVPVTPRIEVSGFGPTELKAGEMLVWEASWPAGDVHADRRTPFGGTIRTRKVRPGSRHVRVYGMINGRFRSGRITHDEEATFQ